MFNNNHLLTYIPLVYTISKSDDVILVFNNNHFLTCIPLVYTISISNDVLLVFNNNYLLTCITLVYTISISDDVLSHLKVTWMLPLVNRKWLTLQGHLSTPVCLRGSCCPIFSFLHIVLYAIVCPFYFGHSIVYSSSNGFWLHLGYLKISLILISQEEKPMFCHMRGSQWMRW